MFSIQQQEYTAISLQNVVQNAFTFNNPMSSYSNSDDNKRQDSDHANFSAPARAAALTGLNLDDSFRRFSQETLNFDFQYTSNRIQTIHATGIQDLQSQTMDLRFAFTIEESQLTGNHASNRIFEFELNLSVQNVQARQVSVQPFKEDIGDYLFRLVQSFVKYSQDKDTEVAGMIFDLEDFKELFELDDGRTMKSLMAAISIVYMTNQMLDKDKEDVILHLPRKKGSLLKAEEFEFSGISMSLKVSEVKSEFVSSSPELQNAASVIPADADPDKSEEVTPCSSEIS